MRRAFTIGGVVLAAGAAAAAWLGVSYLTMPASVLGSAYSIGAISGLSSDHVHAIWQGKTPEIRFKPRQYDMNNSYIWQRATLSRPGNCLDLTPDKVTGRPTPPAMCRDRDQTKRSGNQLHYAVGSDNSISIGVSDKPPVDGKRAADGALFETEGQIGIGPTFDGAVKFSVRFDASDLFIPGADDRADPNIQANDDEKCSKPRALRVTSPLPLWLLPASAARLCEIGGAAGKKLLLVQFESGAMQRARWSDRLYCRALMRVLIPSPVPGQFAGCLGAPWNGFDRTDLSVSLFEITSAGDFASLQ